MALFKAAGSLNPQQKNCSKDTSEVGVISTFSDGSTGIVPDWLLYNFLLVNIWGPGQCVTILGIGTNILNIITFIRQGFRDAISISLVGLASSDLGSLLSQFLVNLCFTPAFGQLELSFYPDQMLYLMTWCHIIFTRTTCWITAYITFERCLCIAAPLKVKLIITPERTVSFVIFLFLISSVSVAPIFYTTRFIWIFDPFKNRSLIGITFIENRGNIEDVVFFVNNLLPTLAFIMVVTCTMVLVRELGKKVKWRSQTAATISKANVSEKEARVVKMVVFISTVFIICYFPGAASFVWVLLDPELRFDGQHRNALFLCYSILFHLEAINAMVNFFIYLRMSSKFKHTFLELAGVGKRSTGLTTTCKPSKSS